MKLYCFTIGLGFLSLGDPARKIGSGPCEHVFRGTSRVVDLIACRVSAQVQTVTVLFPPPARCLLTTS